MMVILIRGQKTRMLIRTLTIKARLRIFQAGTRSPSTFGLAANVCYSVARNLSTFSPWPEIVQDTKMYYWSDGKKFQCSPTFKLWCGYCYLLLFRCIVRTEGKTQQRKYWSEGTVYKVEAKEMGLLKRWVPLKRHIYLAWFQSCFGHVLFCSLITPFWSGNVFPVPLYIGNM